MKTLLLAPIIILLLAWSIRPAVGQPSAPAELDTYNVVWTTPSKDASGSMPIGNGEVGLNVWVEENGDLLFYIARTDAWSECNRLLKLGRIRVSLSPNPFVSGKPFRQELKLREGQIVISADDATLHVFVDADSPVIHVCGESATPRTITAKCETWRTEKHVIKGDELHSSYTMLAAPASIEVWESPDVVANSDADAVVWRHRNEYSVVPLTLKHQSLDLFAHLVKDPLVDRTFGGRIAGKGFAVDGADMLKSSRPMTRFALTIATHTAQTKSAADWEREVADVAQKAKDIDTATAQTAAWWNAFWNRSWIFVAGDPTSSHVTQSYILQRWMTACGGRGNYPIKFNGSIFTVDPKFTEKLDFNPDWRRWGDCYWWQNTRLPYFPMMARGDFDEVRVLFQFYRDVLPLCKARAKFYYNVEGAYFPETMTIFGSYSNGDYGWERAGHEPSEILNPYIRCIWQPGLELSALMLDYYEHTDDGRFLAEEIVPMAHEVLRYYDTRFQRDEQGEVVISPTQAIETYWNDVVNDTPNVAGLNDVLDRLLAIPANNVPSDEHEYWRKMKAAAPAMPLQTENGKTRVMPAEKFMPERNNCENPELYAIWPFRLFGVGRPDLEIGIETFQRRIEKASFGWQYDGQCAAILGLADEAKVALLDKIKNANRNHRFLAMWGPNYDWLPDQDHGSNIMLTLQHMLLETAGDKIFVLPAWPKEWDVSFKLYAPHRTVVECEYRNEKIQKLKTTPESRRNDVQYPIWLHEGN